MLLILVSAPNSFTNWMGNAMFMRKFGNYSFGTYLFHQLAHRIVKEYSLLGLYQLKNGTDRVIFAIILTFVFGMMFHNLVEIPMMNIAKRLIDKVSVKFTPIVAYSDELQQVAVVENKKENV